MDGEISEFLRAQSGARRELWNGFEFYPGTMEGREVVVAKSGVGKSMAACVTQRLIDTYEPGEIIFTGIAGALRPDLEIGDVVVARDCLQHDLDATALGFKRGEIPYTQLRVMQCDPELVELAAKVSPLEGKSVVGRVLTGDQFLVAAQSQSHAYLRDELAGDVVEMEGASVGLVADINRIPFVVIRSVSDKGDGSSALDFAKFLRRVSRNSVHLVRHILRAHTIS
jgi:adenosylhomocysteine nucleosidase/adenosylhomocysteine/aminodeoxyfutalosine nucleosidase